MELGQDRDQWRRFVLAMLKLWVLLLEHSLVITNSAILMNCKAIVPEIIYTHISHSHLTAAFNKRFVFMKEVCYIQSRINTQYVMDRTQSRVMTSSGTTLL
jgi:hypothetical protein